MGDHPFATVREYDPADGPELVSWVVSTWHRHQPTQRGRPLRTVPVIRHLIQRPDVRLLLAVPACDPESNAPFGWACTEHWSDGSETVHFVYVRNRVPERDGMPASPGARRQGIARLLLSGLGAPVFYTTPVRSLDARAPKGWSFDPWR